MLAVLLVSSPTTQCSGVRGKRITFSVGLSLTEKNVLQAKKPILVLSSRVPYPLIGGDRIRIFNFGKQLSDTFDLDLLALNEVPLDPGAEEFLQQAFRRVVVFPTPRARSILSAAGGMLSGTPLQVSYYASRAAQSWLNQSVRSYAGVFVNHIRMAPYVEDNPLPKWIDLHDAISLNYKSAIGTNNGLWSWVYRYEAPKVLARELNAIRRFDKAFIVSERDKKFLVEKGGDAERILVAPVAVSDELLDREFPRGEADEICFVGKMDTVANVDAACYFATEVFPAVLKSRPGFRFVIVGAAPSPRVQALAKHPGITVTGWMKDPHALVYRAKVVVAPMRVGAGMQNKVLEAMAMGKAVVASVLAAEGIGATPGRHYAVADSPLDQAHEIIQLLDNKDRRESLGAEAKRWIREHHTWSTIRSTFIGAMASTIEEANGSLS